MPPWNSARTKVQLKLSTQRLRTLQEKKLALAKKTRREIADLLLKGRVETARIRVEGLIQEDIHVELLELLELYSELLQARFGLLDASSGTEPEASISDAVCSIVYAAPRTELKELNVLREMLMHKYGRTFSLALQPTGEAPDCVPARIRSKLALFTPGQELVDAYLYEIAKGYGVNWVPEPPTSTSTTEEQGSAGEGNADGTSGGDDVDIGSGGVKERIQEALEGSDEGADEEKGSPKKVEGAKAGGKAPSYPQDKGTDAWADSTSPPAASTNAASAAAPVPTVTKKLTPEEELAQRFERLKKL